MLRLRVAVGLVLFFVCMPSLFCRDVIIEFNGSYFLPTHSRFKDCYKGSALYGPELTIQLRENKNWYGFASIDYFKQKGRFLSVCDSTTLRLLPLAVGIKYFIPFSRRTNFYCGLGFQAAYINKKSRNAHVTSKKSLWAFGGIGKIGTYINLPHNFLLDLFFDYSFAWTSKDNFYGHKVRCARTNIGGAIFGAGIGYRF